MLFFINFAKFSAYLMILKSEKHQSLSNRLCPLDILPCIRYLYTNCYTWDEVSSICLEKICIILYYSQKVNYYLDKYLSGKYFKKSLQIRSDHNITTTMAHNLIIGTMAPYIIWVMQESTKLRKYLTITM